MPLTDNLDTVTQYIVDLINTNKVALGVQDVWYGDQELIPRSPAVAVEPGTKTRTLTGMPRMATNNFTVFILVYVAKLQDIQLTRKTSNQLAEAIEDLIHGDSNLGGLVVHGFCTSQESGYAVRGSLLMRAVRISYEAMSKLQLGV